MYVSSFAPSVRRSHSFQEVLITVALGMRRTSWPHGDGGGRDREGLPLAHEPITSPSAPPAPSRTAAAAAVRSGSDDRPFQSAQIHGRCMSGGSQCHLIGSLSKSCDNSGTHQNGSFCLVQVIEGSEGIKMNPSGTPALRLTFERSNGRQHLMPSCVSSYVRDIFDCTDHRWTVVRGYMNLHCLLHRIRKRSLPCLDFFAHYFRFCHSARS